MKKVLLILLALYGSSELFAQTSNLVFYAEQGEKFYVILNGIRQNEKAETNVKVTGLPQPYYKVKVIFEEKGLGELDKTLNFNPGTETVFNVKKNNKGEYVVRWQSETPLAQAPPPVQGQNVVVYTQTAPAGNVTYTESTTTTVTSGTPGANVNMNIPGMSVNVNINDPFMNGTSTTTYSSTTTTTTSSSGYNSGYNDYPPPTENAPALSPGRAHYKNDCWKGAVSSGEFDGIKKSISSNSFTDSQLSQAKSIVQKKCITSAQVRDICNIFSFEDTKLEFAKFAYDWVYDQDNYYVVNDSFNFESSKTDLNNFISAY